MIKVALHQAEFFAHHGFYPEEQLIGTRFMVDIEVGFIPEQSLESDKISQTVNYEELYAILDEEMKNTRKLIETVAQAIIDRVKERFPFVLFAEVTLKKHSPFSGPVKHSAVTISYQKA
ncbi:dihydroneopterin aldolase [Mucilaginibacter segetis]|uniref:7,8-dihydroneopterin aldolase n=1 Tax=Mucilaginibacter segetis TaxID=2793071 RepID=A0A934PW75_9SPHI|nr:dihydroneopterin aldolase [Mucilaginibacter segetis]MBK0381164.1 dihydroneopterin aldolase [Mucilaginibacter segetis]